MADTPSWTLRPATVARLAFLTGGLVAYWFYSLSLTRSIDQLVRDADLPLGFIFSVAIFLGLSCRSSSQSGWTSVAIAGPIVVPTVLFVQQAFDKGLTLPIIWFYMVAVIALLAMSGAFLGAQAAKWFSR